MLILCNTAQFTLLTLSLILCNTAQYTLLTLSLIKCDAKVRLEPNPRTGQGYKATRLQGYKLQGYKATRLQGYKLQGYKLQGYKATRLQGYKATTATTASATIENKIIVCNLVSFFVKGHAVDLFAICIKTKERKNVEQKIINFLCGLLFWFLLLKSYQWLFLSCLFFSKWLQNCAKNKHNVFLLFFCFCC